MKSKYKRSEVATFIGVMLLIIIVAGCGKANGTEMTTSTQETDDVQNEVSEEFDAQVNKQVIAPDSEPEPEPEPEPAQVSLIMVGDILLHSPVEASSVQEDGTYSYDKIFANTKEEIQAADLAIVNQEVIIGGEELGISGYPAFNAPYEIGHDLVETGFDVVCHGTNHALDKGKKGLTNCLNFWDEFYPDIEVLGINETEEDSGDIFIYEKDGIKIAILNYTYSTNGIPLPDDMPYAVDMLTEANKQNILADISMAEEKADFTIVCPHWGTEYYLGVDSFQKKWTEIFLENGVDLVLGTHPHVIEPIEMIQDEETGREMLVYYSLGNFVNWTASSGDGIANRMVGGMAEVVIEKDKNGKTYIKDYGINPVICHLEEGTNGVTVYFFDEYTEELAGRNQIVKQDSAFSLQFCEDLLKKIWENMY